MTKSKIFIVDDHPLVREWLTTLIDQTTDLVVCDGAEDAQSALQGIARSSPDLAIIDLSLGGESGIDLIRMIGEQFPKSPWWCFRCMTARLRGTSFAQVHGANKKTSPPRRGRPIHKCPAPSIHKVADRPSHRSSYRLGSDHFAISQ